MSRKAEWTTYTAAFFSVAILPMANLLVPLWALTIGASPFEIGIVMGARALLPFLFAIHAGALIDRIGTRQVMIFSALASAGLSLLYPVLPWIGALIALQVVIGLITTMGWIGAQSHIGRLTRGEPVYMGRFTAVSTLSNFVGPLIAGIAWDRAGAWGAFGLMALWALAMWVAVLALPALRDQGTGAPPRRGARALLPDPRDYLAALRLVLVPAVALVVACSFLLNAALSMRFAFYVVYLESIDMAGTVIGFLVGVSSLVGAMAALATGPATRRIPQQWLALIMILISLAAITATPLATGFAPLFGLACLFGIGNGLAFAQIISILARIVPLNRIGMSVGLRTTLNRLSSLTIPVMMGAVVEGWDLATSFYAVGALLACAVLLMAVPAARFSATAPPADED